MGQTIASLANKVWSSDPAPKVAVHGLDASGKTTLVYTLKLGKDIQTIPTIGFNVETISHGPLNLTLWDIGLRSATRALVRLYLETVDAIIFVVDSTQPERFDEAKEMLQYALASYDTNWPVLVLANKQDLNNALSPSEIAEQMDLPSVLGSHPWTVFPTSKGDVEGINRGLTWLTNILAGIRAGKLMLPKLGVPNRVEKKRAHAAQQDSIASKEQVVESGPS